PAERVHDDLHARCLVLDDGRTQIAFVICDVRMIHRELVDRAKRLAAAALGWPVENMLVAATHTHAAPGLVQIQKGALDLWYADGRPLAVLANYGLHYVGGYTPGSVSADYFALFSERLGELLGAKQHDDSFVGMMSNGASGDVNNVNRVVPPGRTEPWKHMQV